MDAHFLPEQPRPPAVVVEMSDRFDRKGLLTLAAMSLGYGVVQLDVTIVNTAVNAIGSSLGAGVSALQWIVSTYTIAFAALILTGGAAGDRMGAKRVFLAGFALFTAASLACALAPSLSLLIAARAVQGAAAAILVPNSLALLNHAYHDEKQRTRAVSFWAAGASLALTAGPLAGGVLTEFIGWRSIFLVNVPLGLAALWLTARYANDTPRHETHELDLPGQAAAILALGALAGSLIEAGRIGWSNIVVLAGALAAAVATALFVLRERRTAQPMLPLALFAQGMFSRTTVCGLLVNIAFYGLIFVLSLYFQRIAHYSALATGLAFVPMMGAVLPANIVAPKLVEKIGAPATIAFGALIGAVCCLILLTVKPNAGLWVILVPITVMGAGLGVLVPPLTAALLASVGRQHSGIASGVLNASRQTGSVLGVALFGSLLGSAFMPGFHAALAISAIVLSAAAFSVTLGSVPVSGLARSRRDSRRSG